MLVVITKRYNSSNLKQKVLPTPVDENGKPRYAIYLPDNRGIELIKAGVAIEYVIDDEQDDDKPVQDTNSSSSSNKGTTSDETVNKNVSNLNEQIEEPKTNDNNNKNSNKKNK